MRHKWMEAMAQELAGVGIATFRYEFPYMEKGRGVPDAKPVLLARVHDAATVSKELLPNVPLLAGGKSMGGRMSSLAASEGILDGVQGLVFFGFPLHPAGKPGTERAEHLRQVGKPMLFLQGTRDTLADLELLRPVCDALPQSTVHVIEDADHSFHVRKLSGRNDADVMTELARTVRTWADVHATRGVEP